MSTDVGNIHLDVGADTKRLMAEVRRAAKAAGKDFGKDFTSEIQKSMAPGLSRLGRDVSRTMDRSGRLSGEGFVEAFEDVVRDVDLGFDRDIARAAATQDWGKLLGNTEDMERSAERVRARLAEWRDELGDDGGAFDIIEGDLQGFIDEINKGEDAVRRLKEQDKEAAAALKAHNEQVKLGADLNRRMNFDLKEQEKVQKALAEQMLTKNTKAAKSLQFAFADLNKEFKVGSDEIDRLSKKKFTPALAKDFIDLRTQFGRVGQEIQNVLRQHDITTTGMKKNSEEFAQETVKTQAKVAALRAQLATLRSQQISLAVKIDAPPRAKVAAEGFSLGRLFKTAFDKGSSGGAEFLEDARRRWNEFLQAFPAGVTVIGRALPAFGAPILELVAGISGALAGAVASVGGALVALGGVAGTVLPGIAFGALLVAQAFGQWNEGIGEGGKALERFKEDFKKNNVARFIKEWEGSFVKFIDTLRISLRDDSWAAGIGRAFASITDRFTDVLKSPEFAAFSDAMGTTIPKSIENIGRALAPVAEGMLAWLGAVAPLVEIITEQFVTWGEEFKASVAAGLEDGSLQRFFVDGISSLTILGDLVKNLGDALGTIFRAGIGPGNEFLRIIDNLVAQFAAWLKGAEGQEALNQFFTTGLRIFKALLPVVGAIGKAFETLITPAVVSSLESFLGSLAEVVPVAAELFGVLNNIGLLDILGQLLEAVAAAIKPIIPDLSRFATLLGDTLSGVIEALAPLLGVIAQLFADVLNAVKPLLPVVVDVVGIIADGLVQVLPTLTPLLAAVGDAFRQMGPHLTEVAQSLVNALVPILSQLGPIVADLVPVVADFLAALLPLLPAILDLIPPLMEALVPILQDLIPVVVENQDSIVKLVDAGIDLLVALLPLVAPIAQLTAALVKLAPFITQTIALLANFAAKNAELVTQIVSVISRVTAAISSIKSFEDGVRAAAAGIGVLVTSLLNLVMGIDVKIKGAFIGAQSWLYNSGRDIIQGLLNGAGSLLSTIGNFFLSKLPAFIKEPFKQAMGIKSPSTVFAEYGDDLMFGLSDGIFRSADEVTNALDSLGKKVFNQLRQSQEAVADAQNRLLDRGLSANSRANAKRDLANAQKELAAAQKIVDSYNAIRAAQAQVIAGSTANLASLAAAGDIVADQLKEANKALEDAIKTRDDFSNKIAETAQKFASALNAKPISQNLALTSKDITKEMTKRLDLLKKFNADIAALSAAGLNAETLRDIVESGVETGSSFAQALVKGGADAIAATNSLQSQIADQSAFLGETTANALFQAGVDAAQGLVAGLQSQGEQIKAAMQGLANILVSSTKAALGIASPSKVFAELGAEIPAGFAKGITDNNRVITQALRTTVPTVQTGSAPSPFLPGTGTVGGTSVAAGAITIVTPVQEPAIVASMVLDAVVRQTR